MRPPHCAAARDELRVAPLLNYANMIDDKDAIRRKHRGEVVSDDDGRAALHLILQFLMQQRLAELDRKAEARQRLIGRTGGIGVLPGDVWAS